MNGSLLDVIARKRDGFALTSEEIGSFVSRVVSGVAPDYQIGAMLMAIYLRGMTDRETADLTMAMARSGDVIDLSAIEGFKADKHSTGGVGDKVTPILGPLVAAAGVYFPKLSGRGLGHTGGTIDKLESIPGFRVDLSIEEFVRQVNAIGLAISGQTGELVPADSILYGMRDMTGTVDSVPLIASSVMSKKIAAGADGIVLDVKCGCGAFMQTPPDAAALAHLMVAIGHAAGKRTTALITSMEEPLGRAVGNSLEMAEVIATLRGEPSAGEDLREVCLLLGGYILLMAGKAEGIEGAKEILTERIRSGAALAKLRQMIDWQGGNTRVVDTLSSLPEAQEVVPVLSPRGGFIQRVDALQIGTLVMNLGAGRKVQGEPVDHAVGVVLQARVGDRVEAGETLAEIHTNHRIPNEDAIAQLVAAYELGSVAPPRTPHVLEVVTERDLVGSGPRL